MKHHLHTASRTHSPVTSLSFPSSTSPRPPFSLAITTLSSVSMCHIYFLFNRFTFLHLAPQPPFPLTAVSLIYVSMLLFLFCLLNYFVDYISHITAIIWYLSFSDWLIALSIIISRSIHAVTKGKIIFFITAE